MLVSYQIPKVLSLMAVVLSQAVIAQLPYTYTNAIPSHSSREYRVWENLEMNGDTVHIITTGTDVVWDLSSVQLNEPFNHTIYFEPASATPYHSMYPLANVVQWETDQAGNSDFNYFNNSPFELRLLGGVHVTEGSPEAVDFCPDPFLIMDYPMSIGSGVQHLYDCDESNGEIDNWMIMATGRVVFDGGSIDDLVLWRSVFTAPNSITTSYFWTQMDNMLYPVVRYMPGTHLKIREPMSETAISVEETESFPALIPVYPNPAFEDLTFTLREAGNTRVIVRDAIGRIVKEESVPAAERTTINVADLSPGTYAIETIGEATRGRATFVKQ